MTFLVYLLSSNGIIFYKIIMFLDISCFSILDFSNSLIKPCTAVNKTTLNADILFVKLLFYGQTIKG